MIIMAKNKYSCPICQGSVQSRTGMFHTCAICKKQSITLRRGEPVTKAIALDNLAKVLQTRLEAVTSLEVCRQTEPELDIQVKTVFNDEELDGFIITIDDCFFIHYLEEIQFSLPDTLSSSLQAHH